MNLLEMKKKIEKMSLNNQIEVYKIIDNLKVTITENNNGSFFNLSNLSPEIVEELTKFVTYIDNQEEQLKIVETTKDNIKDNFFSESN